MALQTMAEEVGRAFRVVRAECAGSWSQSMPATVAARASTVWPSAHAAQRGRVETRERMEGIALDAGALHGRVEEPEVERGVVADENRAPAAMRADRRAHFANMRLQRHVLVEAGRSGCQGSMPLTSSDAGSSRDPSKGFTCRVRRAATTRPVPSTWTMTRRDFQQRVGAGRKPPVSTSMTMGR